MLRLRRGRVVSVEESAGRERLARLVVEIESGGETRPALGYPALTGPVRTGDDVLVNIEALDLGLGSGGFDILCANLTRGLDAHTQEADAHVMKLNYTPLQHVVQPLEEGLEDLGGGLETAVGVLALHGQLAPAAFALERRAPGVRVGYVQTEGGALPGDLSDVVAMLVDLGLLADHVTVAPCFGGGRDAITLEGALHAGAKRLGWDVAIVGPGPGILGSASALGHGGLAALHNAHSAISLGCSVVLAPRLSSGDERKRHRGLSHHTKSVLALLLRSVDVAVPAGLGTEALAGLEDAIPGRAGHEALEVAVDDLIDPYLETGLPADTMGRSLGADPDFFRAAFAAGAALAAKARTLG